MEVTATYRITEKVKAHFAMRQLEQLVNVAFLPFAMREIIIDDIDYIFGCAERFQKQMSDNGFSYTKDESVIASIILNYIEDKNIDNIHPRILDEIVRQSHIFHKEELEANPYLQHIHLKEDIDYGAFTISRCHYDKYEMFCYDTPVRGKYGIMIPRIGAIDYKFSGLNLLENGIPWMSISPNEICTMEQPIAEAFGNVLTLGCGIGYYAYMASLKDNVKSVTIIEKSEKVIDLFQKHLLPQFEHKDKIKIIQDDALSYMKKLNDDVYDYCFADIWQNNLDAVPYLELKKTCRKFKSMKISYWIEDSLVASMMPFVSFILLEAFYKSAKIDAHNAKTVMQQHATEKHVYILETLEEVLRGKEIKRPEQWDYYMDYRNIMHLLG